LKLRILRTRILKYAAIVVMVAGIGFAANIFIGTRDKQQRVPIVMAFAESGTHPVSFMVLHLPDGSTVKMNANTRIEYPERFSANIRKVKLSGEAFFDVTSDSICPFIIETENASVEVLGTSFNVSAYPFSGVVEVNVESGKVKLTHRSTGSLVSKSAVLPAGERGCLNILDGDIIHNEPLAPNYSSWITKDIHFQRTPLSEVFSLLENIYHVKIKTENSGIGKIPYTANFANMKLEYIVDVIARTHNLKVNRSEEQIVFAVKTK
jgi:transmembrane sensor